MKRLAWFLVVLLIPVLFSLRYPIGQSEEEESYIFPSSASFFESPFDWRTSSSTSSVDSGVVFLASTDFGEKIRDGSNLEYNFYRDTCPEAEEIIRSTMARIYFQRRDVSAALLRLFFHDCFIQGCDASVLLDDSSGDNSRSVEKHAIPNKTLRGFDTIDIIKEELEQACPGVVSCADIISLATRDGILLAGGPFYPILTGRKDSHESFYDQAVQQIPSPDDSISRTLSLFSARGFNEREIVSLLGAHNIGQISCEFIQQRLYNFKSSGQPDQSIPQDFLHEMRLHCAENNSSSRDNSSESLSSRRLSDSPLGISYLQALSSSVSSGAGFDTHYYRSLLRGRGLLFADQQLMADMKTARVAAAYASDDGTTFRMDFARVMLKMSNLDVLTGLEGNVRLNCSLPVASF